MEGELCERAYRNKEKTVMLGVFRRVICEIDYRFSYPGEAKGKLQAEAWLRLLVGENYMVAVREF